MKRFGIPIVALFLSICAPVAHANTDTTQPTATKPDQRGSVTNRPIPRFVSLKASEGNARRGPGLTHRIDWVFKHRGLPLEITAEYGHWRRIRDRDGAGGWVHYSLLSGVRTVLVEQDLLALLSRPVDGSATVAHLEMGVIARVNECNLQWCKLSIDGHKGWARKDAFWGVDAQELRD